MIAIHQPMKRNKTIRKLMWKNNTKDKLMVKNRNFEIHKEIAKGNNLIQKESNGMGGERKREPDEEGKRE